MSYCHIFYVHIFYSDQDLIKRFNVTWKKSFWILLIKVLHPPADPLLNVDLTKRFSVIGEKVRLSSLEQESLNADRAGWQGHTWTMMTSNRSLQLAPTMKDIPLSTVSKGELVITNNCFPASTNLNIQKYGDQCIGYYHIRYSFVNLSMCTCVLYRLIMSS